jgi:hypothetical protein
LLAPASLTAFTIACWRMAAKVHMTMDLPWIENAAPFNGLFSRWQSWLMAAGLLLLSVSVLDRYGRRAQDSDSAPADTRRMRKALEPSMPVFRAFLKSDLGRND